MTPDPKTAIAKFGPLRTAPARPDGRSPVRGRDKLLAGILIILVPLLVSTVLILSYGDLLACVAVIGALAVLAITFYRIDWGFYIFIAVVLVLDQYPIPGIQTFTTMVPYFLNLKEIGSMESAGFAVVNVLELHLLFIFLVWFVMLAVRRETMLSHVPVWAVALIFLGALALSFVHGMGIGGDYLVALWELRALCYFLILYFFVPQIIQTRSQVQTLMWIVIGAISFKAIQACQHFAELGFTFAGLPTLTSHEDPVFIVTLIIFLFGLSVFGVRNGQHRALKLLLLPLCFAFVAAQRRAAYGAFIATTIAFLVLVPKRPLLRYVKFIVPVIFLLAIYVAAFWSSESQIASPIRLLKTSLSSDQETAADRYYSNLYREYERYDLAMTVRRVPIKGTGFGNMYDQPIWLERMPMSFTLRSFIPHNEFLWLVVKMGAIGFFTFCLFFTAYTFYASSVFSRLTDPYLKSICAVIVIVGIDQIFVSYFDLQLTYYRNMVYFGTLMGLLPALETIDREQQAPVLPETA